jgi:NAD(P)-dependent dehydrogenase (short-subunit alcohol dehydrogenase family)
VARLAIITGSDSGIGKATAVELARQGFDVGITWHEDEDGARETASEVEQLNRRAVVRELDLSQLPGAEKVVDELMDELGGIDAFVNNSGVGRNEDFLELAWDDWTHVLNVNLSGAFLCAQLAARRMVDQGRRGRIVNVTSVHEHVPLTGGSAYVAAKHGLGGLTKQMALELAEHGITVNAVAPGEIATPMTDNEDVDPRTVERDGIPMGRPGDAREVASLIAWLCSDSAQYVTGSSFVIDGGMLLTAAIQE